MPSIFRHIMPLAVCLFLAVAAVVRADVLILANGDRIKGTCIRDMDGIITFKSDILGEILVPTTRAKVEYALSVEERQKLAAAKKLEEEKKLAEAKVSDEKKKTETATVAAAAPSKPPGATPAPAKPAAKTPPPATAPAKPAVAAAAKPPVATDRTPKVTPASWSNRIEFGFTNQSGRKSSTVISLRTETNRRTKESELRFLNRYTYGETENKRSADSLISELRWRHNLTNRFFVQSSTRYERDTIKRLDCDAEQGAGLGANVLSRNTIVVATGADAAVRYRSYLPTTPGAVVKPDETTSVITAYQDMRYKITPRFDLNQDFKAIVAPSNENDYQIKFNTGVTGRITKTFSITSRIELEYDRSLIEDLRYNQRITTTIVYTF